MQTTRRSLPWLLLLGLLLNQAGWSAEPAAEVVPLPDGVQAVWDSTKAYHETTGSRERICLNGLWRWQPANSQSKEVPNGQWGYFKVPGCWPGITDYMQKDSQQVFAHPAWRTQKLGSLTAAWYEREFALPETWAGRRILLSIDYLNSYAAVSLDGRQVGEAFFPGSKVDLSDFLKSPGVHRLSLLVVALPLKGVMVSYVDSAAAREQKGSVPRRGLCGDVYLVGTPRGPRLEHVRVDTSFRQKQVQVNCTLDELKPATQYQLRARIFDGTHLVQEFTSDPFQGTAEKQRQFSFAQSWLPPKLWDIHTPQNLYRLETTLQDLTGTPLDQWWNVEFGFRELWIDGKDFYLNGTRIFLCAVPLDNAQVSAALACYSGARESLARLKAIGINFVYTHNYGCTPGSHLGFEEILNAADDVGMLVSLSQPHFSHYDWKGADADRDNGYARHAAYYTRIAENHPAVVMYSMSHNATGYEEDMNPDLIDGIHDSRDNWSQKNAVLARRAEAIVHQLDPSRIVYHHASGNLGSMHVINFYPNFVPIQELSDWFEHWSEQGIKPAFMCEYGAPFTWDWTMYRGWYKGEREFGSAAVPWEFCVAEWNSQFLGDRAFAISEAEKRNLRWEAQQFQAGKVWHRWDYPVQVGSTRLEERYPVFAMYLKDNWRAFRTWGVSAISPWEFEHFWKLRDGADRRRENYKVDWQNLQRPGFSPDYQDDRYERMDMAYAKSDWEPTVAAKALLANNQPLLAYIGGKAGAFTSKDHIFRGGEAIQKQLILINNSRQAVTALCQWSFDGPGADGGTNRVTIPTGSLERIPLRVALPMTALPGAYQIKATVQFSSGEAQTDDFRIDIVGKPAKAQPPAQVALFDPKGETGRVLDQLGIRAEQVDANADLSKYELLIVGKGALTLDGPAPPIDWVKEGLKVIIFEQSSAVLEKRFGFRVEEYGLRQVFPRIPDHPVLAGLSLEQLRDWRGDSTLLPSRLEYSLRPRYGPSIEWCGLTVPHLWRCGNRGDVASVLIEKPARGDFSPIVDGGYSLQYSPLLEYREGKGLILFCQLDVTGRTESEAAAEALVANLINYASHWTPRTLPRAVTYVGEPAGKEYLASIGISAGDYRPKELAPASLLVVGPEGARIVAPDKAWLATWLKSGGRILAIGLAQEALNAFLPEPVVTRSAEHISTFFETPGLNSFAAGIGPADLHNRAPRSFPLLAGRAHIVGDGMLGEAMNGSVVFCQIAPWTYTDAQPNLKKTHRRASFTLARLLANLGAETSTPILERFSSPAGNVTLKGRWLTGLYIDTPEEWDDPYRHFRW